MRLHIFKHSTRQHYTRLQKAQTFLEFALVLPVILLITYGLIEFGRMVFIYASVTGAAREATRYAAATGGLFTDHNYDRCNDIVAAAQKSTVLVYIPSNNFYIWYDHGPQTNNIYDPAYPTHMYGECPPKDGNGHDKIELGDRIGVRVHARYSPMIAFLGFNGFDIISENARTILVDINIMATPPTPYPPYSIPPTNVAPTPTKTPVPPP